MVGDKRRTLNAHPAVPLGSKLLTINIGDGVYRQHGENLKCRTCGTDATEAGPEGCMGKMSRYGVYYTPEEWHWVASKLVFPMDCMPFATPWQARAMKELLESTPGEVVAKRSNRIQRLIQMITELKHEEARLRVDMPEHVRHIMQGKRILLFRSLLKNAGIEDPGMMKGMTEGFPLMGHLPSAGWFPRRKDEAGAVEVDDLLKESASRTRRLEGSCKPSKEPEDDAELWKKCQEEVEKGWSTGPYTRDEVDMIHGKGNWVAAKRFAIWQSAAGARKIRVIDDYTISGQNGTVVPSEKLDHAGLDEIIAIIRCMGQTLEQGGAK
eukprot:6484345-Amphidinium_carterae.1